MEDARPADARIEHDGVDVGGAGAVALLGQGDHEVPVRGLAVQGEDVASAQAQRVADDGPRVAVERRLIHRPTR